MTQAPGSLDLVILVPGKDEQVTMRTLLSERRKSLAIRELTYDILVHPRRDPGCFLEGPDVLQPYVNRAQHALLLLDYVGSGQETRGIPEMEHDLERRLASKGWEGRAAAVVIDPELEAWVWSDSSEVDVALGWKGRRPNLRDWLRSHELLKNNAVKPDDPKRAVELARYEVRLPRSSALFGALASTVSLERCGDPAFHRLKRILKTWFAGESSK